MRSLVHSAANGALLAYASISLNEVAIVVTIASGLASLILTILTIRRTLREDRHRHRR